MNKENKYLLFTICNAVLSALISVALTYNFLDFKDKSSLYLTFVIAFWMFFNLQKLLLKEMELSGDKE